MKRISILGVTGSIGVQAIDVLLQHPEFELVGISAGKNIPVLEEILSKIKVRHVCVMLEEDYLYLKDKYPMISFYHGKEGLNTIATLDQVEIVLNAIVGFAGLIPTINAIKCNKDIALANKETLVVAGHIIMPLVEQYQVQLLPVDSEHSAIFQSLQGSSRDEISKIILTCSGGSFLNKTKEELEDVTIEEALNHPNWSMGSKITIDSATLFNKGLEVIEAKWLFDLDYDAIEVLIHPQSVVHSMVEYKDTSVIAQLGTPDMKMPIQYAFSYPKRISLESNQKFDLSKIAKLTFMEPDTDKYKSLELCYKAGIVGGSLPCVLNAANEVANAMFLAGQIKFKSIEKIVALMMDEHQVIEDPSLDALLVIDNEIREKVLSLNLEFYS